MSRKTRTTRRVSLGNFGLLGLSVKEITDEPESLQTRRTRMSGKQVEKVELFCWVIVYRTIIARARQTSSVAFGTGLCAVNLKENWGCHAFIPGFPYFEFLYPSDKCMARQRTKFLVPKVQKGVVLCTVDVMLYFKGRVFNSQQGQKATRAQMVATWANLARAGPNLLAWLIWSQQIQKVPPVLQKRIFDRG